MAEVCATKARCTSHATMQTGSLHGQHLLVATYMPSLGLSGTLSEGAMPCEGRAQRIHGSTALEAQHWME
eukprot:1158110-Pelagomonas_calceolata.AAC.6